jgi:hypothetical protein
MSRIRTLGVAALVMALAVAASSARAADENKKSDSAIHGVVTAINMDKDNDVIGTFTIQPAAKKSKDAADAPAAEKMTFKVKADTKFAKVAHKKKDAAATAADAKAEPESTPATFADLNTGDVVAVEAKDGVAVSVKFHTPRKKKPA